MAVSREICIVTISDKFRQGPNHREIRVGDAVLMRRKAMGNFLTPGRRMINRQMSWVSAPGLVVDSMESGTTGYMVYEVLFETEVGWWEDYELKLIEKVGEDGKDA